MVFLMIGGTTAAATAASSLTSAGAIPARLRPSATTVVQTPVVVNNSANAAGTLEIVTNGDIIIFNGIAGNFTNAGTCGWNGFNTSWSVD